MLRVYTVDGVPGNDARRLGARHVILVFSGRAIELALERMEGFARDLRPALEA